MEKTSPISFINNRAVTGREDKFEIVDVFVLPVLASWKSSLFAHEWLNAEGKPKEISALSETAQEKRKNVEEALEKGAALERPVLGLGILDNLEIGAGKDVFLTLAARGVEVVSTHIPKSHLNEFKVFIKS